MAAPVTCSGSIAGPIPLAIEPAEALDDRIDHVATARAEARHLHRTLSTWVDDDGMVVIRGRLTPEAGAVVQRALEAAADQLFREAQGAAKAGAMADEVTPGQRRADALGLLAEAALAMDLDRGRLATAIK